MVLIILRCIFLVVAGGMATLFVRSKEIPSSPIWLPYVLFGSIMLVALVAIALDVLFPRKRIDVISAVYFGVLVGFLLTYVVGIAMEPVLADATYRSGVQLILGMLMCYTCVSVLLQTKDDFRFVIPYVEFSKQLKGLKPYILDTSAVIDGRIADVAETNLLDNPMFMPRFVLNELQAIADSSDRLKRVRGRRGLDILNRLRNNKSLELTIYDHELPQMANQPVDMKLVLLAQHVQGKLVTGDYNLNKMARVHNVTVINLNDLANALKPVFLPGEGLEVKLVKAGEEDGQGIGYLDDGTMIVVEGGRPHLNQRVKVAVTSVLQTSAGRMIFGKFEARLQV